MTTNHATVAKRPTLSLKPKAVEPSPQPVRRAPSGAAMAVLRAMIEIWPQAFRPLDEAPVPLEIGIRRLLLAPDLRPLIAGLAGLAADEVDRYRLIDQALRLYCGRPRYLKAIIRGGNRIRLDGSDSGVAVDDQAQAEARRNLAEKDVAQKKIGKS